MEAALRATEPHLNAMYETFTKLNAGEPVGAESLARVWRPRASLWAIVLIPVMFASIVIGALLSGSARGSTTCGTSQSAARDVPLLSRASCSPARKAASYQKTEKTGTSAAQGREALSPAPGALAASAAGTDCTASPPPTRTALRQHVRLPFTATGPPPAAALGTC
jgi:hypothetical protein